MAKWVPASLLLLIALLSWNVNCFPATKGWSQSYRNEGGFPNTVAYPGSYYSSSERAPAQPSALSHAAVSSLYEPVNYSPETYPASPSPGMSSVASWNTGWDPAEESTTVSVSRTSQPRPDIGIPRPPQFQAGELDHYETNMEHGNSEVETEKLGFMPPPPPAPYPGPVFQAGELSKYSSIFEHGNEERETEEQGFRPPSPYASAPRGAEELSAASFTAPVQPAPRGLSEYYLFLTGQHPPGTLTHSSSDYETGADHWGEVHYERYHYPMAVSQTQQEVPADVVWQQPQYPIKGY